MWKTIKISMIIGAITGVVIAIYNIYSQHKKSKCPICKKSLVNNYTGKILFNGVNLCKHCSEAIEVSGLKLGNDTHYELDYLRSIIEDYYLELEHRKKIYNEYIENEFSTSKIQSPQTEYLKYINLAHNCLKENQRYSAIQFYVEALKIKSNLETLKELNRQINIFNKEENKNIKYNNNEKILYDGNTGEVV